MKFLSLILALTALAPVDARPKKAAKPPYFVLTGDSTVAVAGGWGDGFLSYVKAPADGINPAKSGATTASFRADGRWNTTITAVQENVDTHSPIVTIQFGHNDQKAASGISLEQFQANLVALAEEVIAAGGTPILITSLTRRAFNGSAVIENLNEHSAAAIAAAESLGIDYLDLNKASTAYVNAIGKANADLYNLAPGDRTHLNPSGEKVFGRLVVDLLLKKRKDLRHYFEKDVALSKKIAAGEYATGEE
ncbi:hypothetical protein VD0002_g8193 [Verticillium dahliae]|uniref:Acetylesterase n=2 Tax=Verticillium dahliae TaxID=27337 RepID=G2X342_VERDV|nr:acetylesterase [Verticillium dahliae VdLs.17]KAF3351538.1 NADH-ubiquinone oxidoreductase 21 kDa subunit [Verticillium dahliae VDG2]KAH6691987.1 acetylesterase [Verticillium dahliae]EGY23389.1 acetylesterase [Verticillium dahliae VdLs.17]PNH28513.1 hypothetical protein BJF96_g8148 [Verticillium dahliae]PNH37993.1 hypothetical protein VD0004_g8810 [Verticillium dahliae]